MDAKVIGEASVALGAGRAKKTDDIDHAVGFVIHHKVGDRVKKSQPLFTVHANDKTKQDVAVNTVMKAFEWSGRLVPPLPLFY